MINSVRNTVLSVLNKNNYGYISPNDFNLFAKQAQLEIFKDYFNRYNNQLVRENARQSNIGYADIRKQHEEAIEIFGKTSPLVSVSGKYTVPSDCYMVVSMEHINADGKNVEVEKVPRNRVTQLTRSNLTQPVPEFPMYVQEQDKITIYPTLVGGVVSASYIRYPKDPKWTYSSLGGGEPIYNPSQPDFQDLEISSSDESLIVNKILQYSGMSIREIQAMQFSATEEQKDTATYAQQL